ncbi:hypothetical protein L7F22_013604 [Adiantum nelumboides]|nr:hypothetical protein [Adiantum nelumboides]
MKLTMIFMVVALLAATSVEAQQDHFLSAHNGAPRSVRVAPLVWDSTVAQYARRYGERQRDNAGCALQHSGGPYGENLFKTGAASVSPADVVGAWINEKKYYNYGSNICAAGKVCGHYTQVVWAASLHLGFASIACNNGGGTFVICNYHPPGNYVGKRPY